MIEKAYAKVNLALDVTACREDGYHELEMVNLPLNFYDILTIEEADKTTYHCNRSYIRFDGKNTVVKALELLKERFCINKEFEVKLHKQIPTRAGLGGGSADAAAVFRLLQKMYALQTTEEEWTELAARVGADVPFCLFNRPAVVRGIGEKLEFFELKNSYTFLLVKPRRGVSTKEAFDRLDMERCDHTDVQALSEALQKGDDRKAFSLMKNSLERSSFEIKPSVRRIKEGLLKEGYDPVMMSGSGATVFAICEDEEKVRKTAEKYRKQGCFARVCISL